MTRYLSTRDAIDEGLADALVHAPVDLDESYAQVDDYYEPMAEWEITLLTPVGMEEPPAETAWVSTTAYDPWASYEPVLEQDDTLDEDDEPTDWWPWLTGNVREVFPDGGYVIEGPGIRTSVRTTGYLRVHELAAEVGIRAGHMVEHLCMTGEFVAGTGAYVALPVCDRTLAEAGDLRRIYGLRPDLDGYLSSNEALHALRARLTA